MRKSAARFFLLLVALALPIVGLAWMDTGHMIVAAIAFKRLKPSVREQVQALLKVGADEKTRDFYSAACWADDTKNRQTGPWHYIDYYFRSDGKPAQNKSDPENVVWAINRFSTLLADKTAPELDRANALRYLIHFVGDIHQPLHAVSRETYEMPKGDAGGNRFEIKPVPGIDMWRPNLHALWDFGCGLFKHVDRPLVSAGKREIDALASKIVADFPAENGRNATSLDPQVWAHESAAAAKAQVYQLDQGSEPSAEYLAAGRQLSERRLALAGYRLAALLNKLLG